MQVEKKISSLSIRILRGRVNIGLAIIFLGAALINLGAFLYPPNNEREQLHIITIVFCIYIFIECRRYVMRTDAFGLIAPPFLASLAFAFLSFIFPVTVSIFIPAILFRFESSFYAQGTQLSQALIVVAIAIFFMWRGYSMGLPLAKKIRAKVTKSKLIRTEWRPKIAVLYGLQFLYLALVAISINLGIFGIASSEAARNQNSQILALLNYGVAGGSLSLMLLLLVYFTRRANGSGSLGFQIICMALFGTHLIVGALSGFKSQLVFPFIMLFMAQFLANRRINLSYVAMGGVALLVAYLVIEPYRVYLNENNIRGQSNVMELADAFLKSKIYRDAYLNHADSMFAQISSRSDLNLVTALGIQAADHGIVNEGYINSMKESIYLSPILAFIPRFIWSTKESYSTGTWFNQIVMGNSGDSTTSVGMGPVAFFYFIGDIFGVITGFFFIGLIQALIFDGIGKIGAGGVIIYLGTMGILVLLPGDVGPALTGLIRILPIIFIAQLILLNKEISKMKH